MKPNRSAVVRPLLPLLVLLVSACASRNGLPSSQGTAASAATSATGQQEPADVAHIVCGRDGVTLETAVVRAHEDGVRVIVENPGGGWGFEFHPVSYEHGQAMGSNLEDDPTEQTWTIPPGEVIVACLPDRKSTYYDPGLTTAMLTVVDPDGLYVPWHLACGFGYQFRMRIAAPKDEDPASVLRRVPGVLPTDEVKRPKYPESPRYSPMEFIVVRDDESVGLVGGPYLEGEWRLIVNACPGSGIEKS